MQYVMFVREDGDEPTLHTGPVADADAAYLGQAAGHLEPLADEEYVTGPAVILHTTARYSYVLDGDVLYWCVEWAPGMVMVRMEPDREMAWVALRSPVPNFGGRVPLPEDGDPDDYGEDNNPQYNLVFRSWDAQYDSQYREWRSFIPADADVQGRFKSASARADALVSIMESRFADDRDGWIERCKGNLEEWAGEGVRIRSSS